MGIMRAYFFDAKTNEELTDHPLNGKSWLGTSGNIFRDGVFVRGTCTSLEVCDHSSLRHVAGEVSVSAADFDRPVVVKVWGPKTVDWRVLVADEANPSPEELKWARRCERLSAF